MVQNNQWMERKEILGNVRKQLQINLIQQKNRGIGSVSTPVFYVLFLTVLAVVTFYASKEVEYYSVFNGYSGILWIGIGCILVPAHQMFRNDTISMYPGNAITRYLGRILADHIQMFLYILCVGLLYVMQCGLLWLFLQGKTGVDVSVLIDPKYLAVGLLRFSAYSMALYGGFALFLALDARFGIWFRIAFYAGLLCLVGFFVLVHPKFMTGIGGWIQGKHTALFPYLSVFVLIWLVCIVAAGIVACTVRSWKIGQKPNYIGILVAVLCFFCIVVLSNTTISVESDTIEVESESGEGDNRMPYEPVYGTEDLYSNILISLPENNCYSMDEDMVDVINAASGKKIGSLRQYINNVDNIGFRIGRKSEAADLKIPKGIDLSGIDEEHGILIYQCYNVRINGQDIYRDLMEDLQNNLRQADDRSKIKLEYAGNLKCIVCLDFFPSADRFLYHGSRDLTMKEYNDSRPYLLTTLLVSDKRYEEFEAEMDQ